MVRIDNLNTQRNITFKIENHFTLRTAYVSCSIFFLSTIVILVIVIFFFFFFIFLLFLIVKFGFRFNLLTDKGRFEFSKMSAISIPLKLYNIIFITVVRIVIDKFIPTIITLINIRWYIKLIFLINYLSIFLLFLAPHPVNEGK